ncbi:MAG TPA: DUF2550 domain-containing protein [Natronosporangium sp.]|nr:DUF2550 domain-containing protein [Natronosporangium sp.]
MRILEWIAIGALTLVVCLALLFLRRWLLTRSGNAIELSLRVSTLIAGRGWAPGFARLVGEQLRWYRMFSLSPRPRRVLMRRGLVVESRRSPTGSERFSLPEDWVILRCISFQAPVELAMAPATLTGFLSWIEASPPGSVSLYTMPPGTD